VGDVDGKNDGADSTRDVGVPQEEVVGKQNGAGFNRAYEGSDEDVFGKQNGAVIGIRKWPQ